MNWQDIHSRPLPKDDILFLPASARTVSPDEVEALEIKRIRRLRELGPWRPSRGWQVEPALEPERPVQSVEEIIAALGD